MSSGLDRSKDLPTATQQTAIDITAEDVMPHLTVDHVADLVLLSMVSVSLLSVVIRHVMTGSSVRVYQVPHRLTLSHDVFRHVMLDSHHVIFDRVLGDAASDIVSASMDW